MKTYSRNNYLTNGLLNVVGWVPVFIIAMGALTAQYAESKPIHYEGRKKSYIEVATKEPQSQEALNAWIGMAELATHLQFSKYDDALYAYKQIRRSFPDHSGEASFYIAYLYHYYLFDYKKALASYKDVAKTYDRVVFRLPNPWGLSSVIEKEQLLSEMGRLETLVSGFDRYEKKLGNGASHPTSSDLKELADLYRQEGNFLGEIEMYQQMIDGNPNEKEIVNFLYHTGKIYLYDIPSNYRTHGRLGKEKSSSSMRSGIRIMEQIYNEHPDSSLASMALLEAAKAYMQIEVGRWSRGGSAEIYSLIIGDYSSAEKRLTTLIEQYPQSPHEDQALYYLGMAYESEKLFPLPGAKVRFGKVAEEEPYDPKKVKVHGLRKFSEAITTYNVLISKYPDSEYSVQAIIRLDALANRSQQKN